MLSSRSVVRVARATAWMTAAFGLSVGAHVVGGGAPPSSGGAVLMAIALLWTGLMLTRWRLGPITLTTSLGTSQLLLHWILTATEVGAVCSTSGGQHEMALSCATGAPMPHHSGPPMLLAHAVATVLLALLLAKGEDAVWFITHRLWPRLPRPVALPSLTRQAITPSRVDGTVPVIPLLGGVGRRGPPLRPAPATA